MGRISLDYPNDCKLILKLIKTQDIAKALYPVFLEFPISVLEHRKKYILLFQQHFDVFLRCGNRCNTIVFYQKVQNVRRKERR